MSIGKEILIQRKKIDLTRRQVALAVGVVDSTMQKWELDMHLPKLDPVQMRSGACHPFRENNPLR